MSIRKYVRLWDKYWQLAELLEVTPSELAHKQEIGRLKDFSKEELDALTNALFSETHGKAEFGLAASTGVGAKDGNRQREGQMTLAQQRCTFVDAIYNTGESRVDAVDPVANGGAGDRAAEHADEDKGSNLRCAIKEDGHAEEYPGLNVIQDRVRAGLVLWLRRNFENKINKIAHN
ncbi:hypothetical protein BC938DRAFT_471331 [Jimgerdemannia flammicorona]|uniref:Uncharacterized protein n=1 Tax=Jimgerdemannia flammicorona TaxID=994334 RepID=A0A433Q8E2_9FUNG|nr:hypothetical protein BC938DRAFT_471331 [Jimgerdemannia flammicorona]